MATRRLVLIRHAKAAATGADDSQRPLAERGGTDAPAIGGWLAERALVPDRVVVSTARRAVQTWELAAAALSSAPEPALDERLYGNTVDYLLEVIHETPADVHTLVLVGHNPSIEELAAALDDGGGDATASRQMAQKYPTSAVAVFAMASPWAEADTGAGRLTGFSVPRGGEGSDRGS